MDSWVLISFYFNSVPSNIKEMERIADSLDLDVTTEELWAEMCCYNDIPHVGNIYMGMLFSRFESYLKEHYGHCDLDIDYYINGLDTHFYINHEKIYTQDEFFDVCNQLAG